MGIGQRPALCSILQRGLPGQGMGRLTEKSTDRGHIYFVEIRRRLIGCHHLCMPARALRADPGPGKGIWIAGALQTAQDRLRGRAQNIGIFICIHICDRRCRWRTGGDRLFLRLRGYHILWRFRVGGRTEWKVLTHLFNSLDDEFRRKDG